MLQGPVRFLLCALAFLHTLTRSPLQRNLTGGNGGRGPRRRRAGREGAELRLLPRRREGGAQHRPPAQLAPALAAAHCPREPRSAGGALVRARAREAEARGGGPSGQACEPCSPLRVSAGLWLCVRLAAGPPRRVLRIMLLRRRLTGGPAADVAPQAHLLVSQLSPLGGAGCQPLRGPLGLVPELGHRQEPDLGMRKDAPLTLAMGGGGVEQASPRKHLSFRLAGGVQLPFRFIFLLTLHGKSLRSFKAKLGRSWGAHPRQQSNGFTELTLDLILRPRSPTLLPALTRH